MKNSGCSFFDEKNIYYYGEDICYSFIMKGGNLCNKIKFHIFIFLLGTHLKYSGCSF
nr:MAG TPA: hypothetical protein [Caudoviricetes sp.]